MFEGAYIFLLVAMIPFFSWQQREDGRSILGELITGAFLVGWIFYGSVPFAWDNTTMLALCFGAWMIASMSWSGSRQSGKDLYMMLTCLVVFLVARGLPLQVLLSFIFLPGVIFAGATLIFYKSKELKRKWFIFGNYNHIGAFLLIPLFAGAWLTFNLSWWIAPLVVLIAVAIGLSQCRGAQIAVIIGLMYVACMQEPKMLIVVPFALAGVWLIIRSRGDDLYKATSGRISFLLATFLIIKKAPISGHGLRTFRREYPAITPEILDSKLLKHFFARGRAVHSSTSHRVHNDHLEIICELGLIGYVLLVLLFSSLSWTETSLLSGAFIAFAVHGLFFFPFREAHTAFPFWAMAGGMAGTAAVIPVQPILGIIAMLVIARVMYGIGVILVGLIHYDKGAKFTAIPNPEDNAGKEILKRKQFHTNQAIHCDPYNNFYLTEGYFYNVFDNPETAFQYASRCMENYDGGKVRWGVCDQYARAVLRLGGLGVAKMAVKYALHICPDFKQSQELMGQVIQMEKDMKVQQEKVA